MNPKIITTVLIAMLAINNFIIYINVNIWSGQ